MIDKKIIELDKDNYMKFIDKLVGKFGTDKILHFLGGGWIVSMFSPLGWVGVIIGVCLMLILSFVKEKWLDNFFEWKDIIAASLGGGVSILIFLILKLLIV